MLIDIDSLLNATDGWNFSLVINGNQFIVDAAPQPPPVSCLNRFLVAIRLPRRIVLQLA